MRPARISGGTLALDRLDVDGIGRAVAVLSEGGPVKEPEFLQFAGVHYDPAHPQAGRLLDVSATVTVKPDARLNADVIFLKSRLREHGTGRVLFNQNILSNRTNYQFTREHAARAIVDYNTLLRRVSVSLLYTYLPRPNTSIYAGYGDVRSRDVDPFTRTRLEGLHRERRTLFVKLSHQFRR